MITLILLKYSANVASAFPWVVIYMCVCVRVHAHTFLTIIVIFCYLANYPSMQGVSILAFPLLKPKKQFWPILFDCDSFHMGIITMKLMLLICLFCFHLFSTNDREFLISVMYCNPDVVQHAQIHIIDQ